PAGAILFWHQTGRWAKKVRGKLYYFGRGSYEEALAEYDRQKQDLHSGRVAHDEPDGLTVYQLCARFLMTKKARRDSRDLAARTFFDYAGICKLIIRLFGRNRLVSDLGPADFEKARIKMSKTLGLVSLWTTINKIRVVLNYSHNKKQQLIEKPILYGEGF